MLYKFFFNYYFFILELVIKQALVIFLGEVETSIWSKLGLCHCATLTLQTQGDAHCLALTNTSSNNSLSFWAQLEQPEFGFRVEKYSATSEDLCTQAKLINH